MTALLSQANPKALPNPLESYASYNYVLSLSALNKNQINDPDGTYMSGGDTMLICKSGNADPTNRVNVDGFGKNDFFITNLELDSMIGFRDGKNTNVITVSFEIYEPYSIGLFLLSLQLAAARSGFPNHHLAPYLLTIEFRGNKESGVMQEVPNTKKFIPIIINSIDVTASESGARYTVNANVHTSYGQSIIYSKITKDIVIKGKTVQETLQSLESSLQYVINQQKAQGINNDKTGTNAQPDQILIIFPKTLTSPLRNLGSTTRGAKFTKKDTIVDKNSVFQKLGTVEKSVANSQNQIQAADINNIAESSLSFGNIKKGDNTAALYDKVYKQKTMNRSSVTIDDSTGSFRFAQGTNIVSIINEVILNSDYAVDSLKDTGLDEYGNRKWWRVETQTYYLGDNRIETNNIPATLTVYRVLEYLCHSSIITGPGLKPYGIDKVNENVPKVYNYMYTGNDKTGSTEIMKFDISYKFGWFTSLLADKANLSQDTELKEQRSAADSSENSAKKGLESTKGARPVLGGTNGPAYPDTATETTTGNSGGGGTNTEAVQIARQFHALISNPLEMISLDMEILGDPFWISSSGMGNYIAPVTKNSFINSDYSVNFQTGEVYIHVNFKSPIDINQATGLYSFPKINGAYDAAIMFKGVYRVNNVTSIFRDGVFKQVIKGYRVNNQYEDKKAEPAQTLNTSSSYWGQPPSLVT